MQSYSLNGYLNAVLRRTGKTLLVEGVTDQSVMIRLKREKASCLGHEPGGYVDISDLIDDPLTRTLGKKNVIQVVLAEIEELPDGFPERLSAKLGVLFDREWDGLNIQMQLSEPWAAPEQESPYFVTHGHSVENYFFKIDIIESYLRQHFYAGLDQNFFNALRQRFDFIIALGVAYSLAVRQAGAITRSSGLICSQHVSWENGRYVVENSLVADLNARGAALPDGYLELINQNIDLHIATHPGAEPGRWLCHGHLGQEAMWACIANLAVEFGLGAEPVRHVERGHREAKLNHAIDHLSRQAAQERAPLNDAIEWLTAI